MNALSDPRIRLELSIIANPALAGRSNRLIAKYFGLHRTSVDVARRALESRGLLRPVDVRIGGDGIARSLPHLGVNPRIMN
jgi:hypothetical protein